MASEPLLQVGEGKPRAGRLIGIPSLAGDALAAWMAGPPRKLTVLEPGPGELAAPGPRAPQNRVPVPARPGGGR